MSVTVSSSLEYTLTYHIKWFTQEAGYLLSDKVRRCLAEFFERSFDGLPMDNMIAGYCITENQVNLIINGEPETRISGVIEELKNRTDEILRKKFKDIFVGKISYIWNAGYSVSTWGTEDEEEFGKFVENLKKEKSPITISGIE